MKIKQIKINGDLRHLTTRQIDELCVAMGALGLYNAIAVCTNPGKEITIIGNCKEGEK